VSLKTLETLWPASLDGGGAALTTYKHAGRPHNVITYQIWSLRSNRMGADRGVPTIWGTLGPPL